jgi:methylmalonyl-CoA mutase cobalamin-binding domain/chain
LADTRGQPSLGSLVIATPKGDIHDIGKNIVSILLKICGFDVHDLGVDVPVEKIVDTVIQTDARVVAMSALITPTFESMKQVVDQLEQRDARDGRFVIVGGGVVTQAVQDYVGADAWTSDPKKGVNRCRDFVLREKK